MALVPLSPYFLLFMKTKHRILFFCSKLTTPQNNSGTIYWVSVIQQWNCIPAFWVSCIQIHFWSLFVSCNVWTLPCKYFRCDAFHEPSVSSHIGLMVFGVIVTLASGESPSSRGYTASIMAYKLLSPSTITSPWYIDQGFWTSPASI